MRSGVPRRVAVLSLHTSPLAQPGTGDAGGMNVYVLQTAIEMARRGAEVEIFTRATSSADEPIAQAAPGVTVRNLIAGPFEGLDKHDLPTQLCAFAAGVLREEARHEPGYYDLVHSHYWLSGQVGWLVADRWGVPLVHTAHTLGAVKNANLADGDRPEPAARVIGERQVAEMADHLVANTAEEAKQLIEIYGAAPGKIDVVAPGADLSRYTPGDRVAARRRLGLAPDDVVVTFVGRIQPLKAPDVLLRAAARLLRHDPDRRLRVLVVGGPSGTGLERPSLLIDLAAELGITDRVDFRPPQPPEKSRRGVPRVRPGGGAELQRVLRPGRDRGAGLRHPGARRRRRRTRDRGAQPRDRSARPGSRHRRLGARSGSLLDDPAGLRRMGRAAREHAAGFSWAHTADGLWSSYRRALADYHPPVAVPRDRAVVGG